MIQLLFPVILGDQSKEKIIFNIKGALGEDFQPKTIVDVGANKGKWSEFLNRMYPSAEILMVEADEQHKEKLEKFASNKRPKVDYTISLLSSKDDQVAPWYGGGNTGNSMFRENSETYENDKPVSKKTYTLDTVVKRSHLQNKVDILKLDVQGAELVVLQGATEVLKQVTFIQLEASTVQYNLGGSCMWQVDQILRGAGYALYDLGERQYYPPMFKTTGVGQYDVIYINTNNLPAKIKDVNYCTGTDLSANNLERELEQFVGLEGAKECASGGGGRLLVLGLILGYLVAFLQGKLARFRRLRRED